jgi:anti-sigma factor RsiW
MAETMTCRELNDFLADYRDGDLAPEVRSRFEGHLVRCAACAAYVRSYQQTVRLVRDAATSLDQQLLPPDVPGELVDAILDSTVGANAPRPRRR